VQTYIMFSTGPGQVAADGSGANSDFSAALAANLVPDVSIDDIGAAVSVAVYDKTGQKPWISDGMPHNPVLSTGAPPPPDAPATDVAPEDTSPEVAVVPPDATTVGESDTEADLAFQDALREDTLEGYRKFLERYPNHPRRQLILDFYERIADEEMWQKVLLENTLGGYARYLDAYPDGIYVELARQKQEELRAPPEAPAEEQVATREGEPDEPEERGFILYRGYDFEGGDLLWLEDETLEGCEESCRDDGSCRAFTFNVEKRICILKSGYGRPTPHEEAISGAYADGPPVDLPTPSPVREFTYY
jgi:PAN domain